MLTAIALGAVFYKPGARVAIYALVATVFTVVVQGAMNVPCTPFGIPTLTAPFVLVTWLFLLPRQTLRVRRRDARLDPRARLPARAAARHGRGSRRGRRHARDAQPIGRAAPSLQGVAWGTGHTLTLMLFGGAVLVAGAVVPARAA